MILIECTFILLINIINKTDNYCKINLYNYNEKQKVLLKYN